MTNRELAENDPEFRKWCGIAGIPACRDQYRKYKRGRGLAYLTKTGGVDTVTTTTVQRSTI